MKKFLIYILAIIMCCSVTACSQQADNNENADDNGVIETPPNHYTYTFDTYDHIRQALTTKGSKDFSKIRSDKNECGKVYVNTLSAFESNDIRLAVPQLNGTDIKLRDKEGYSNISLMTAEAYNLPWIWYHCVVGDYDLDVKISYPKVVSSSKINSAISILDVLSVIAPNAPTPTNYQEFSSYKSIFISEIALSDGNKIVAMISELKDSPKVYVKFYQNGMLLSLYADSQLFTEEFWNSFEIENR